MSILLETLSGVQSGISELDSFIDDHGKDLHGAGFSKSIPKKTIVQIPFNRNSTVLDKGRRRG